MSKRKRRIFVINFGRKYGRNFVIFVKLVNFFCFFNKRSGPDAFKGRVIGVN